MASARLFCFVEHLVGMEERLTRRADEAAGEQLRDEPGDRRPGQSGRRGDAGAAAAHADLLQQLEAAKAQHTLQLQEAVSLARRQWSKKGGEELARKTQEVTSLTASLAREARIVAELRRALKDKAARGGSGGEVLRPSQREETLASRLSAAEARAAGAEAVSYTHLTLPTILLV